MSKPSSEKISGMARRSVGIVGVLLVGLHIWAAYFPSASNWGIHCYAFFPDAVKALISVLMVLCLIPSVQQSAVSLVIRLVGSWKKLARTTKLFLSIPTLALAGIAFWIGREGTTFLGDGYWLERMLPTIQDVSAIWLGFSHEPLTGYVVWNFYKLMLSLNPGFSARDAFAVVSVLSGMCYLVILGYVVKKIIRDHSDGVWIFIFLIATAGSQLFFGYVENYTIAYVVYLLFVLTGILCLRDKLSLIVPSTVFAVVFDLYFGALAFAPLVLYLYVRTLVRKRYLETILSVVITLVTGAALLALSGYNSTAFLHRFTGGDGHILPLFAKQGVSNVYSMLSPDHLVEIVNLQLLLSPFALILLTMFLYLLKTSLNWRDSELIFILLNAACGLGMMFIFLSDLGISRDWDLMAIFGLGTSIALAYILPRIFVDRNVTHRVLFMITSLTLLHSAGFILVNANEKRAIPRSDILVLNDFAGRKSYTIYEQLAIYHRDRGDYPAAIQNFKNFLGYDSLNARILGNLADVYHRVGNEDSEMVWLEQSARHFPNNKMVYINLAKIYVRRGRFDESAEMTIRGLMSDSPTADTLTDLGIYSIKFGNNYQEGLNYFLRALTADSSYADAYLNAGIACKALGRPMEMKKYLTKFLQLEPNSPKGEMIRELISTSE